MVMRLQIQAPALMPTQSTQKKKRRSSRGATTHLATTPTRPRTHRRASGGSATWRALRTGRYSSFAPGIERRRCRTIAVSSEVAEPTASRRYRTWRHCITPDVGLRRLDRVRLPEDASSGCVPFGGYVLAAPRAWSGHALLIGRHCIGRIPAAKACCALVYDKIQVCAA